LRKKTEVLDHPDLKNKMENHKNARKSRAVTGEIRKDRGHCHKTQRCFLLPQSQ